MSEAYIVRRGGGGGGGSKVEKLAISNLTEGTIVRIKEKGVETDYYLAQHNYQPSLNGSGRVLFVRKECHSSRQWHTTNVNAYAGSAYDAWLNGEFKSLFDADVREAMGETMFPYTTGNGSATMSNMARSVFALSTTELGVSWSTFNVEGTATPIASVLKIAQMNGSPCIQLTRTPVKNTSTNIALVDAVGNPAENTATALYPARPAFTLPNTATVLEEANSDGSYTLSLGDDNPNKQVFKLTVVDGTTKPTNPANNTLWVNTDVDIGMVYLAPNAPTSPEVGDVWVNTANKYNSNGTNASSNLIRVNDKPYLEINVMNISQWNGSAWVNRDGSAIYANGAWASMALFLWNYGTKNDAYPFKAGKSSSSVNVDSATAYSLTYADEYIQAEAGGNNLVALTSVPVDLTNYNKSSVTYKASGGTAYIGAYNSSNPKVSTNPSYLFFNGSSTTQTTVETDISTWSGMVYPGFRIISSASIYIYQWVFTA